MSYCCAPLSFCAERRGSFLRAAFVRRVAQGRISPLPLTFSSFFPYLIISLLHYFQLSILHFAERLIQQADALVHVSFGDVEHRREPQHVAEQPALADEQADVPGALHHLRGSFRRRLLGFP